MSGQRIQLRTISQNVYILPQGATLADFIAACQSHSSVQKVDFYIMTGVEEIIQEQQNTKNLSFYSKAIGSNQRCTLVEQPPFHQGKLIYKATDNECKHPLSLSNVDPVRDLKAYAWESAVYIAQHGFNVASYFRFKSGPIEEVCRIMAKEAKKHAPLAEPVVIYL
ncbi:MAG: hypothetical protein Q8R47_03465 [Nanoarchaeota archaeon]|nr:hypothetical protein [Nanoarchaeota archaeon]